MWMNGFCLLMCDLISPLLLEQFILNWVAGIFFGEGQIIVKIFLAVLILKSRSLGVAVYQYVNTADVGDVGPV